MITKNTSETLQALPRYQILGIRIHALSLARALSLLEKWIESNKQYQITTPNPEQVVLAQENPRFREVLNQADLSVPDGIGLVWAIKRQRRMLRQREVPQLPVSSPAIAEATAGRHRNRRVRDDSSDLKSLSPESSERGKIERIAGVDVMVALCKLAAKKNWRVFLLGAKEAAALTTHKLQLMCPKLRLAFDGGAGEITNETSSERKRVINKINDFRPHLLFVAYGAPYQELWIAKNLPLLRTKIAMGVGGAFDYLAGKVLRAPKWLQNLGLEWFYRLLREPWRWRRQLALLKFIWLVLLYKRKQLQD